MKTQQRVGDLAAHCAADAARFHQDDIVVDPVEKVMVEPDLAELVDGDRGAGHGRIGQKALQERRLARTEEAGEEVDRRGTRGLHAHDSAFNCSR